MNDRLALEGALFFTAAVMQSCVGAVYKTSPLSLRGFFMLLFLHLQKVSKNQVSSWCL